MNKPEEQNSNKDPVIDRGVPFGSHGFETNFRCNNEIELRHPEERKKVFMLSGGAGRIIAALPAFQKHLETNGRWFNIVCQSGMEWFLGTELQDLVYDLNHKDLFKEIIKPGNLINLEPYHEFGYYNQENSLADSFDKLINNTDAHGNLQRAKIVLSKSEEIAARDIVTQAKNEQKHKRTVVFQPFGRNAQQHKSGHVIDATSRSLSTGDYFDISEKLREKYNVIAFTEIKFDNDKNQQVTADLRHWAAIIEAADYFVGVDSCGQHMAHAFNKPGSVILGSTFAENISYPKHFNIVEKPNNYKQYSPIRIHGLDGELADRVNDTCMDFTETDIEYIIKNILLDIEKKIGVDDIKEFKEPILNLNASKKSKSKKTLDEIIDINAKAVNSKPKKLIDSVLEKNQIKS